MVSNLVQLQLHLVRQMINQLIKGRGMSRPLFLVMNGFHRHPVTLKEIALIVLALMIVALSWLPILWLIL